MNKSLYSLCVGIVLTLTATQQLAAKSVTEITSEKQFEELVSTKEPIVVDFYATWCGACKEMDPVFKKLAKKYSSYSFVKVDVEKLSSIAKKYNIHGTPTFVFLKDGKQQDSLVGVIDQKEFEQKIEDVFLK